MLQCTAGHVLLCSRHVCPCKYDAGAQPRFQSWGVQFLGVGYFTEQNTDTNTIQIQIYIAPNSLIKRDRGAESIVYPLSCTALCYVTVITLFVKKVRGGPSKYLWGPDPPPDPLVVAPLVRCFSALQVVCCCVHGACVAAGGSCC